MPRDGQALIDFVPPEVRASWDPFVVRNEPLPPLPLSRFGVTDPSHVAFIEPRLVMQPWRTFYHPVRALKRLPDIPVSYVACTGYGPSPFMARLAEMEADPTVRVIRIETGHHCMLTAVEDTVAAIL